MTGGLLAASPHESEQKASLRLGGKIAPQFLQFFDSAICFLLKATLGVVPVLTQGATRDGKSPVARGETMTRPCPAFAVVEGRPEKPTSELLDYSSHTTPQ